MRIGKSCSRLCSLLPILDSRFSIFECFNDSTIQRFNLPRPSKFENRNSEIPLPHFATGGGTSVGAVLSKPRRFNNGPTSGSPPVKLRNNVMTPIGYWSTPMTVLFCGGRILLTIRPRALPIQCMTLTARLLFPLVMLCRARAFKAPRFHAAPSLI